MVSTARDTASEEAIRLRLQKACSDLSQAEIARKTGYSATNVARYLASSRIPAEFCARLATELGINLNWLLTGNGLPRHTNPVDKEDAQARDFLQLLEDLNAITKARIGALVGEDRAKLMHQLKATIDTYQRLQRKLDETTGAAFKLVLDEYLHALKSRKLPQARDIQRTAELLNSMNSDAELGHRYMELFSIMKMESKDFEGAFDVQRRLVEHQLLVDDKFDPDGHPTLVRYIDLLSWQGYRRRALRLIDAFLALGGADAKRWQSFGLLRTIRAHLLLETGRLQDSVQEAIAASAGGNGELKALAETNRLRALLFSGALNVPSALKATTDVRQGATSILWYAIATEDRDGIELTVRKGHLRDQGREVGTQYTHIVAFADALAAALDGQPAEVPEVEDEGLTRLESLAYRVLGARIAFLSEQADAAARLTRESVDAIRQLPEGCEPPLSVRVLHARNLLASFEDGELRQAAGDLLNSLREHGYCIDPVPRADS